MEQKSRKLPVIELMGTPFLVDVESNELREKDNPQNAISVLEMTEVENGYSFDYDPETKNLADDYHLSNQFQRLEIPWLSVLDPKGIARKYDKKVGELNGKTDYEVMVDQQVLSARLKGRLTTIDIAGHTFYVDLNMECIRPKDDFSTMGINFSDLENYVTEDDCYFQVPYNPDTHQMAELDYENMTSIPKGVIMVEFPTQQQLDPVGYARQHGFDLRECLRETPIKAHFVARIIRWEETYLPTLIQENIRKKQQEPPKVLKDPQIRPRRRGPRKGYRP